MSNNNILINYDLDMGYVKGKEKERHVSWLELFYDLVYAAAIAQLGQNLSHDLSIEGFVKYVMLFVIVCWAWTEQHFMQLDLT